MRVQFLVCLLSLGRYFCSRFACCRRYRLTIVPLQLVRVLRGDEIRAYADDTAAVVCSFAVAAPLVERLLRRFAAMSGLELNLPKTVVLPLWEAPLKEARADIAAISRFWGSVVVAGSSAYLGFQVGPAQADSSWTKPLRKFEDRARHWGGLGLGLHLTAHISRNK